MNILEDMLFHTTFIGQNGFISHLYVFKSDTNETEAICKKTFIDEFR